MRRVVTSSSSEAGVLMALISGGMVGATPVAGACSVTPGAGVCSAVADGPAVGVAESAMGHFKKS